MVDVKARDQAGRVFQIEVQLQIHTALPARALYSWARTYAEQLGSGQGYHLLKPTLAIWIVDGVLFPSSSAVHHRIRLLDAEAGLVLTDQIELHMLQLPRFRLGEPLDEEAQWVYFLKEARNWTELPASLNSPALEKAMEKLDTISESTVDRERYRAREAWLREQATLEFLLQEALRERERERQEAERERERLRERLRAAGIDPDA
mgnify:CR=1 FL=1